MFVLLKTHSCTFYYSHVATKKTYASDRCYKTAKLAYYISSKQQNRKNIVGK